MLVKILFKPIVIILLFSMCCSANLLNLFDSAAPLLQLFGGSPRQVCYGQVGCFKNDGPFSTSPIRPISPIPDPPELMGTKYLFYSRRNPDIPQIIDATDSDSFSDIEFNPKLNTKIIIHGYKGTIIFKKFQVDSFLIIKDGILENEDANVISVNWKQGATSLYFQAVANTRVVGAQIALLIKYLINVRNARPEHFHLIGFSLGAHISGYVGQRVANLGKITALDAAKPYFDGLSKTVRLDASDALFIEAFHTDYGVGTENSVGDIDIFFNKGDNQPGCESRIYSTLVSDGIFEAMREVFMCDHKRSLMYYQDFLLRSHSECTPIAYRCESWDKFTSGYCSSCGENGEDCAILGLNSHNYGLNYNKKPNNKFFIITNDRQPYCVFQYLVIIAVDVNNYQIDGKFHMRFHSSRNTMIEFTSKTLDLRTRTNSSFVISHVKKLSGIKKLDLIFLNNQNERQTNDVYIRSIRLIPLNIYNDYEKIRNERIYCTIGNQWTHNDRNTMIKLNTNYC